MTWTAGSGGRRRLRLTAAAVGAAAVLSQLPTPATVLATLSGTSGIGTAGGGALEQAALTAVAAVIWPVSGWLAVTTLLALISAAGRRGGSGAGLRRARVAESWLRRLAPRAFRQLLFTAVGVGALAGAAACSAPTTLAEPPAAVAPAPAVPVAVGADQGGAGAGLPALGLDWPTEAAGPAAPPTLDWPTSTISTPDPADRGPVDPPAAHDDEHEPADHPEPGTPPPDRGPADPPAAHDDERAPADTSPDESPDGTDPAPVRQPLPNSTVTVAPGDSLWSIAEQQLPADADDATVDRLWRQWYQANRTVIGADPNLLLPGWVLVAPTGPDTDLTGGS